MTKRLIAAALVAAGLFGAARPAAAGFVIIDGTDANDHGTVSGGANQDGWLYMQRVLENLAAQRLAADPSGPRTVYNIGANAGTQAGIAIASAFNLSSLASTGWTLVNVTGAANINTTLSGASAGTIGILAFSTADNSTGDLDVGELAAVNANATAINAYLGAGGALHSMAESGAGGYGWLSTLLPGFLDVDVGAGGNSSAITLTAAGSAAFPGLNNGDLSSGPWHNYFAGNFGGLSVLATAPFGGAPRALILGGVTGNITDPVVVPGTVVTPAPATALVLVPAAAALGLLRRRRVAA